MGRLAHGPIYGPTGLAFFWPTLGPTFSTSLLDASGILSLMHVGCGCRLLRDKDKS